MLAREEQKTNRVAPLLDRKRSRRSLSAVYVCRGSQQLKLGHRAALDLRAMQSFSKDARLKAKLTVHAHCKRHPVPGHISVILLRKQKDKETIASHG